METAIADTTLQVPLNYVDPDRIGPNGLTFNFDPAWSGIPVDKRVVAVKDAARLDRVPALGAEGFQTVHTGCPDLGSLPREEIERYWMPAVRDQLQEVTGADAVDAAEAPTALVAVTVKV